MVYIKPYSIPCISFKFSLTYTGILDKDFDFLPWLEIQSDLIKKFQKGRKKKPMVFLFPTPPLPFWSRLDTVLIPGQLYLWLNPATTAWTKKQDMIEEVSWGTDIQWLDLTHLNEFRADSHPAVLVSITHGLMSLMRPVSPICAIE